MRLAPALILDRPGSQAELIALAENALRGAGAVGRLPTPIGDLIAAARVGAVAEPEVVRERFLAGLSVSARAGFASIWQKLRGIADLRDRVIYVPPTASLPRDLFAKSHEFGHQVIPWHTVPIYHDDDRSLSQEAEACFEHEANFFAAEVIFQGRRFRTRALDYRPSLDAVFRLADEHGASRQATLRRYVDDHDEAVAAVTYLPSRYTADRQGNPILWKPWLVASPVFRRRCLDLQLPEQLPAGHEWAAARDLGGRCDGDIVLGCGAVPTRFEWQGWWSGYSLTVLLRRPPTLGFLGRIVRGS